MPVKPKLKVHEIVEIINSWSDDEPLASVNRTRKTASQARKGAITKEIAAKSDEEDYDSDDSVYEIVEIINSWSDDEPLAPVNRTRKTASQARKGAITKEVAAKSEGEDYDSDDSNADPDFFPSKRERAARGRKKKGKYIVE